MTGDRPRPPSTALSPLVERPGSPSDVLMAVVRAGGRDFEAGVPVECETLPALKEALVRYGVQVMGFLNRADVIPFTILMHEEVREHPQMASRFFEEAYSRPRESLSVMIARGQERRFVGARPSADEMAEQLMDAGPAETLQRDGETLRTTSMSGACLSRARRHVAG